VELGFLVYLLSVPANTQLSPNVKKLFAGRTVDQGVVIVSSPASSGHS